MWTHLLRSIIKLPTPCFTVLSIELHCQKPYFYPSYYNLMSENTPVHSEVPKKSNKNAYIIALLSLVVVVQGVKIYLDSQEKQQIKTDLTSTEQELATTMQRMTEISTELDQKIAEVKKLGGDISDMVKAKEEVEAELKDRNVRPARKLRHSRIKLRGMKFCSRTKMKK